VIIGVSPDLPHTADLPPAKEIGLRIFKPMVAIALRAFWHVHLHGAKHVPAAGPVILASNHIGLLDGPVLEVFCGGALMAAAINPHHQQLRAFNDEGTGSYRYWMLAPS